jgi:acyl dehydratase
MRAAPRFAQVGESFSKRVTLDVESIRSFARSCGDTNPLHHDEAVARASRFGRIIACGPHTASLLLALSAEHFARSCAALGLDFRVQFRKAVKADETITFRWTVTRVEDKPSMQGELVEMEGEGVNEAGERVLSATGLVLATESL